MGYELCVDCVDCVWVMSCELCVRRGADVCVCVDGELS